MLLTSFLQYTCMSIYVALNIIKSEIEEQGVRVGTTYNQTYCFHSVNIIVYTLMLDYLITPRQAIWLSTYFFALPFDHI